MCPWAGALFAADRSWWSKNRNAWEDFAGMKFTWSAEAAREFGLRYTPGTRGEGLGKLCIHAGGSSGYMAVGLAYFLGAAEIYLLGFDMQFTNGQSHWHGDHINAGNPTPDVMKIWAQRFIPIYEDLKCIGIPLVNCTRETIMTIPRKSLEDVLNAPKPSGILASEQGLDQHHTSGSAVS
jgi:hypothetical protein